MTPETWPAPIVPLQHIVAGNHDRTLANAPSLHFSSAAEILLLVDTLERAEAEKAND